MIEKIMDKYISCTCNEGYKSRGLADPDCPRHSFGDSIEDAMKEYANYCIDKLNSEQDVQECDATGLNRYRSLWPIIT